MKKNAWTTGDELRFIEHLGQHSTASPDISHQVWVKSYQRTLALRRNWGAIDPAEVQVAVEKALAD